jgi:hypothetical protein
MLTLLTEIMAVSHKFTWLQSGFGRWGREDPGNFREATNAGLIGSIVEWSGLKTSNGPCANR